MKLAVAVLSSILLALSVTTANPVNPSATTDVETSISTVIPSATTSTEASTSSTPNPKGIGLGALDPLPGNVKELLKEYVKIQDNRNQQRKICWLLQSQSDIQRKVVMGLEKKLETLEKKPQGKGGSSKHNDKIRKAESNLEKQYSKFVKLQRSLYECESEIDDLAQKEWEINQHIASLVFGTTTNVATVDFQTSTIKEMPSVKDYLEKQSLKNKDLDRKSGGRRKHRKSGDQRKHKDFQPLLNEESDDASDEESGSGSSRQKVPSKKRKRVSKLMDGLGSFFKRPGDDDREPLT
ncbi:hypothetical protein BATDEDRAFT_88861 [Batrachochytrium dendrobatidis JAM81]|uniref:Uncharacterized protein n=2 Tax=Batrachochytrium dendrobatidis TaxID=109871 RepID=F4P3L9_BATDJ|nr:uncharacterized protein BATDEDRAFT_88861 [Batrachochytrium dendrobatidis JAM81]EGF80051.1 hypothetical protein BATDEDRAFT_88861 [Batrachochytrium dendrobatidis JAM81]OAJ41440.1 hypothetical protein BDEG_25035 [Batrachochytrium dendrobatidis JEL423]|eukprot:XP_006679151.1 hypothetical protein BATDEDRAFT_88861 [Batrachochytrium dendrobatidis JAM81]